MATTRTWRAAALLVLALAAGCRSQPEEPLPPAAQVRTPTPSPTAETFEVPAVIDSAYVERVVNALHRVEGGAIRSMLEAGEVTPRSEQVLRAVYSGRMADGLLDAYRAEAERGFPTARRPMGETTFAVSELRTATPTCVLVGGLRDFSQVNTLPTPTEQEFIWLYPLEQRAPDNPTPWRIELQVRGVDGEPQGAPEGDRCA